MKNRIFTATFLLCAVVALAQNTIVQVRSDKGEAVEYAHIQTKALTGGAAVFYTTDQKGMARFNYSEPLELTISFIGFLSVKDTIYSGGEYNFTLKTDPIGLSEVVVTAQYAPESEKNSIFKVKVLGQKQIENRAAVNLSQLLENQLNIRIANDNAIGSSGITMQGLGGENVKILIDGVPMIGRLDGTLDLNQVNLANIDRVEIVEGPLSVAYGSNAQGGVINLITKKPQSQNLFASADGYYESVGVYNFNGSARISDKKNGYKLGASRNFFQGYDPVDNSLRNKQWNQKEQIFGELGYTRYGKRWEWNVNSLPLWEQIKDKGEVNAQNKAQDVYFDTRRWMNTAGMKGRLNEKRYLEVLAGYTYYDRIKNTYIKDMETLNQVLSANPSAHDTSVFTSWMSRATMSEQLGTKWAYQVGYDVNYETAEGKRIVNNYQNIADYAVFASAKWNSGKWQIQPALRVAYNSKYDAPLVPALNIKYNVTDALMIRGGYARGFRAPSLKELYLDFVDVNHNVQGNENLMAEDGHNLTLNASWTKGKQQKMLKLEAGAFYNYINNKIQLVYIGPNPIDFANTNIGTFESVGGKVSGSLAYHPHIEWQLGTALTGIRSSEQTGDNFYFTPELNSTINYFAYNKSLTVALFYKLNGAAPQFVGSDTGTEIRYLPVYHMMDLTVSKRFFNSRVYLAVGAKNILDVTNIGFENSSGGVHSGGGMSPVSWGRTFFVSLKYQIDKSLK